ncbi:hypothetical protein ASG52_03215 [Methylobacterium sp. Leaf456]|uniref:CsbD family protein n=1 Tax=Methylobacterium sp. Leaf456 TaxID=1736382 RepID=UPI0006F498F7|nr:CsbD family protein [Methylobacterium sp. Leaf456]KQT57093.1 hypothetical protein ASG52_03215 [Methylobacterium sp. Leaf456]
MSRKRRSPTQTSHSTSADALKGSTKEAIGKLTGKDRVEAEGRRQTRKATPPKGFKPRAD